MARDGFEGWMSVPLQKCKVGGAQPSAFMPLLWSIVGIPALLSNPCGTALNDEPAEASLNARENPQTHRLSHSFFYVLIDRPQGPSSVPGTSEHWEVSCREPDLFAGVGVHPVDSLALCPRG
eukprot:EG_transcript_43739